MLQYIIEYGLEEQLIITPYVLCLGERLYFVYLRPSLQVITESCFWRTHVCPCTQPSLPYPTDSQSMSTIEHRQKSHVRRMVLASLAWSCHG